MRQRSDLRVVTAPNDAVDDEDAQNGKEKWVLRAIALSGVWGSAPQNSGVWGSAPQNSGV
ncbi:MAG: hypothetical protein WC966_01060 [Bradymonadales bacterium]